MGRKGAYLKQNKSKRNKRSKAAKLRWSKASNAKSSPTFYDLTDDEDSQTDIMEIGSPAYASSPLQGIGSDECYRTPSPEGNELVVVDDDEMEIETYLARTPNWCAKKYEACQFQNKNKEFGIISSDECDRIANHPLCIEADTKEPLSINGNRIVELGYVIDRVLHLQYTHSRICTDGKLCIKYETRRGMGLVNIVTLECNRCSKLYQVPTENQDNPVSAINTGAVWGTLATGSTFSHLEELLSCMDIPTMPEKMFYDMEKTFGIEWKFSLLKSMEIAGTREKEFAIANEQFSADGTPWIKVYVDGSWSKRSYGTNFNSLSGMLSIIGGHTGEILFISVRNRFCSICARAETKGENPKQHTCYKNWSESAPAMEADMAVEGFNLSLEMHGVKYGKFVADGDSSVYAKIKEKVSYGEDVKKLECTNHALKNYGKNLRKIKGDSHISTEGKQILTLKKIELLTRRAKCSIYEHAKNPHDVSLLRQDLQNGLHHVFGDHSRCRQGICNDLGDQSENLVPKLNTTTMYFHLTGALNLLVRKAHLLVENENNNRSERFMNVVARFNMGKRLNLVQRGSYERRVHISALSHNKSSYWYASPWKKITQRSPGQFFKKFMKINKSKHQSKVRRRLFIGSKKTKRSKTVKDKVIKNKDYGKDAEQPPEDPDILMMECGEIIQKLQVSLEKRDEIEELSRGQFGNAFYECERKLRLTASLFGNVVKRRPQTSCHNLVKQCIQPTNFYSEACENGIANEGVAINLFERKTELTVQKSGLWVDLEHGFLGASPDGLTSDDAIIEVKCLSLGATTQPMVDIDGVVELKKSQRKSICLHKENGVIKLKRNHNYYYQIQGQLNITKKNKCYFIVYVNDAIELFVEEIYKDSEFWTQVMLPKLTKFYQDCIAPEIVRNNLRRGLKCVDPPYIKEAIKCYEQKKQKKIDDASKK